MKRTILILFALSIFIPTATHADITTGLVDWWRVDQGTGTTGYDNGSNNLSLTTDGTWLSPGNIGASSMQFNGSSQSATAGNSGAGNAYTMSAWVKKTGSGSNNPRAIFFGSGDNYIDLCFSGGPMFSFSTTISGQTLVAPGTGCANTDEWHHYAATWDGSTNTATLYYDGSSIGSNNSTTGVTIFTSPTVAQYAGGGLYLNGAIDDLRIYNRALTSGDVAELYLYSGVVGSLVNETFEGTGTPTGWFKGGSADFDSTASPLQGAQSLRLNTSADYANTPSIAEDEIWGRFLYRPSSVTDTVNTLILDDAGFTQMMGISLYTDGTLIALDNGVGVFDFTTDAMSANTTYYVWFHYKKGSGANAVIDVMFDTTCTTRPSVGSSKWAGGTTGVSTSDIEFAQFSSTGSIVYDYDDLQISNTDDFATCGGAAATTPFPTPTLQYSKGRLFINRGIFKGVK